MQDDRSKELDEAQELLEEDEVNYLMAQQRAVTLEIMQGFVKAGLATQAEVDQIVKEIREKDGLH